MTALPEVRVKVRPSDFVQDVLCLNGKKFSIAEYPYLIPIYNTSASEVGLFTARQIAKSTTLASIMTSESITDPPGSNQVLVTPLQEQAYTFSTQRLRDFINESPIVKKLFFTGPKVIDQMLRKVFSHGNMITLGYAQRTADRLRGKSAGKIKFDEIQDIFPEVIPVVKEMAFRVEKPSFWYCGTPKSMNNHMEKLRRRSTAGEWAVKCREMGCNKWNYKWNERNISHTGVVCEFCQKSLNTNMGQWIAARKMDLERGKDAKITMESYRIPQLIVKPIMDIPVKWRELLDKVRDYPTEQLYNEVFGLPFDSGTQPVTIDQLRNCCDPSRHNVLPDQANRNLAPLVMGIDWAFNGEHSFTFVTIGGWQPFPQRFQIYYWKCFKGQEADVDFQLEWIKKIVREYNIRLIGADWGAGHVQNLNLINTFGEHAVAQLWHTGRKATGGSKAANRAKYEPKTRKWHLARTAVLTDTFEDLRHARIVFPRYEECDVLFSQVLAESLEFDEKQNRAFYTNVDPDDGLHSLTYCMLAGELLIRGGFGGHIGSESVHPGALGKPDDNTEWDVDATDHSFYN